MGRSGAMWTRPPWCGQFRTPDRNSYTGLGQLYVDNAAFKVRYDAKAPGLAEYLRDATAANATRHLD